MAWLLDAAKQVCNTINNNVIQPAVQGTKTLVTQTIPNKAKEEGIKLGIIKEEPKQKYPTNSYLEPEFSNYVKVQERALDFDFDGKTQQDKDGIQIDKIYTKTTEWLHFGTGYQPGHDRISLVDERRGSTDNCGVQSAVGNYGSSIKKWNLATFVFDADEGVFRYIAYAFYGRNEIDLNTFEKRYKKFKEKEKQQYFEYFDLLSPKSGSGPFSFQITRTGKMLLRDQRGKVVGSKDLWYMYFGQRYDPNKRCVLKEFVFRPCCLNANENNDNGTSFVHKYIFMYMCYVNMSNKTYRSMTRAGCGHGCIFFRVDGQGDTWNKVLEERKENAVRWSDG